MRLQGHMQTWHWNNCICKVAAFTDFGTDFACTSSHLAVAICIGRNFCCFQRQTPMSPGLNFRFKTFMLSKDKFQSLLTILLFGYGCQQCQQILSNILHVLCNHWRLLWPKAMEQLTIELATTRKFKICNVKHVVKKCINNPWQYVACGFNDCNW